MGVFETALLAGLGLGLLSSLHCGAMCGGICAGALVMLGSHTGAERSIQLGLMQAGRVSTYVALGWLAASASALLVPANAVVSLKFLQWAAAAVLIWVGLSLAGLLPELRPLDRVFAAIGRCLGEVARALHGSAKLTPFVLGTVWGASGCPILYAALASAALTGSPATGATLMLGFGLGTVPAVAFSGGAISSLRHMKSPVPRAVAGVLIATVGFLSVYVPWNAALALCLSVAR